MEFEGGLVVLSFIGLFLGVLRITLIGLDETFMIILYKLFYKEKTILLEELSF